MPNQFGFWSVEHLGGSKPPSRNIKNDFNSEVNLMIQNTSNNRKTLDYSRIHSEKHVSKEKFQKSYSGEKFQGNSEILQFLQIFGFLVVDLHKSSSANTLMKKNHRKSENQHNWLSTLCLGIQTKLIYKAARNKYKNKEYRTTSATTWTSEEDERERSPSLSSDGGDEDLSVGPSLGHLELVLGLEVEQLQEAARGELPVRAPRQLGEGQRTLLPTGCTPLAGTRAARLLLGRGAGLLLVHGLQQVAVDVLHPLPAGGGRVLLTVFQGEFLSREREEKRE
jgi:hypothetical protein